jgi:regulator of cell morphogenesis and NO signaling
MALEGVDCDTLVRDVLLNVAGAVAALDRHRVDHCCHGELSLAEACDRVGADLPAVLAALEEEAGRPDALAPRDRELLNMPLEVLTEQLVTVFHEDARRDAVALVAQARALHDAEGLPVALDIARALESLFAALLPHLSFEERHVFPYLVRMEKASREGRLAPVALFANLAEPLAEMTRDHEDADHHLDVLSKLTNGYQPDETASPAVRALYAALAAHHEGLVRHMHLEGNVLFPRAERLEAKLREGQPPARRR